MTLPDFIKYTDIERLGHEETFGMLDDPEDVIVIEEKIDGGNAQFRLWDGELLFGTRNNHFKVGIESPQSKQFGTNARWVVDMLGNKLGADSGRGLNPDYIYFGEWCKKHTINYNWDEMPAFIGFDILNVLSRVFLPYSAMVEEYTRLGIPTVPLLLKAKVSEVDITRLENFITKSAYYDGTMEGIVIKNYFRKNIYGRQMFAKLVTQNFKEANMAAFGGVGGVKKVNDDTVQFMETFYTDARIRKAVHRLVDEGGQAMGRELMQHLPRAVVEDIWKEETWTIIKAFDNINFGLLKKQAPKLCLRVLDQMLMERVIPVLNSYDTEGNQGGETQHNEILS